MIFVVMFMASHEFGLTQGEYPPMLGPLNWDGSMGEPVAQVVDVAWDYLQDFEVGDFDGDGATDLLFADRRGLMVCWGDGGGGLQSSLNLLSLDGVLQAFVMEKDHSQGHVVWMKTSESDELVAHAFHGRQLARFNSIHKELARNPIAMEEGLLLCDLEGGIFLAKGGALNRLNSVEGKIDGLDVADFNGDGQFDLVIQQQGDVFISLGNPSGSYSNWVRLDEDGEASSFVVCEDVNGQVGILVKVLEPGSTTFWFWNDLQWERSLLQLKRSARLIAQRSKQFRGAALVYVPVNQSLFLFPFRKDGELFHTFPLAEVDGDHLIRIADWDGDGDDDLLILEKVNRTLHFLPFVGNPVESDLVFGRHVLHTIGDCKQLPFQLPIHMDEEWIQGMSWHEGVDEWLIAEGGLWGLGASSQVRNLYKAAKEGEFLHPSEEAGAEERSTCIKMGYLQYEEHLPDPCLKVDFNQAWHHLTYSRGNQGETEVAMDGVHRFSGSSAARRYDHRMLQIGAAFGTKWGEFSAVDIDEVELYEGHLSKESILSFHMDELGDSDLKPVLKLNFDSPAPLSLSPLAGELTLEGGTSFARTPWGKGLRLDGKTGRAHTFFEVPKRNFVLDFRFKLNKPIEGNSTLVSFYGMYNFRISVGKGIPIDGLAESPVRFELEEGHDSLGGFLFTWGGEVVRMLSSGAWMQPVPGGWECINSGLLPPGDCRLDPWADTGICYGIFGEDGEVWKCEYLGGDWEFVGIWASAIGNMDHVVSTGHWPFMWREDREELGWLDLDGNSFYQVAGSALPEQVLSTRPAAGGVEFMDEKGNWWLVPRASGREGRLDALSSFSWQKEVWGVGVFLSVVLVFFVRRKFKAPQKGNGPLLASDSVAYAMVVLQPHAGTQVEVAELDAILGIDSITTDETRRSRRSRVINDVNGWSQSNEGIDYIERHRDPTDRRRTLYKLSDRITNWTR